MLIILATICLIAALALLVVLSIIDMKEGLLPNEHVFGFMSLGLVFHLCTTFQYADMTDMVLGGFIGFSSLYLMRALANWWYKDDALGLGDVKLLGAAGIWLGPYFVLIALAAGALAGVLHGLVFALSIWRRTGKPPNFSLMSLPAGPGFAVGIVVAGAMMLLSTPHVLF